MRCYNFLKVKNLVKLLLLYIFSPMNKIADDNWIAQRWMNIQLFGFQSPKMIFNPF